jgi:hypothetical protein
VRFPAYCWKSRLRFGVPARIALQGGERAGADAMYLSTPSTKTCRQGPRLPSARRERFRGPAKLVILTWPRGPTRPMLPDRVAHTLPSLRHTKGCVLAEPSNNNKKRGRGQRIGAPSARIFLDFTRSTAASRRRYPIQSRPGGWCSAGYRGYGRYPSTRRERL